MGHALPSPQPAREIIAPRHESLVRQFEGGLSPEPPEYGAATLSAAWAGAGEIVCRWAFRAGEHPQSPGARFVLRLLREDGAVECELALPAEAGSRTLPAREPCAAYRVELGFYTAGGVWGFMVSEVVVVK